MAFLEAITYDTIIPQVFEDYSFFFLALLSLVGLAFLRHRLSTVAVEKESHLECIHGGTTPKGKSKRVALH
jgi:hypothetical protein